LAGDAPSCDALLLRRGKGKAEGRAGEGMGGTDGMEGREGTEGRGRKGREKECVPPTSSILL